MDIVEEIRQDREKGAKRLESEYKSGLMALARRFCADPSDAEELVNATFATVIENIDSYLEQSAFFGWMCQILTSHHSRNIRRKSAQDIVYPGVLPDVIDEKAQEEIYDHLDATLLRKAIDELPKEQRDAIALHYFMDMSVVQIAKYLAVPTGTVMSRLHYARKALAAKLGAKVEDMAKRPGGKAILLALLLCGITALGAAVAGIAGLSRAASRVPSPAMVEDAGKSTIDIRQTETCDLQPTPSPVLPQGSSNLAGSPQRGAEGGAAFSTQGETMNITTTAKTVAAIASASLAFSAAADLPQLDSSQFDYKYEMLKLPTAENLDGSSTNDFAGGGSWLSLGTGADLGSLFMAINANSLLKSEAKTGNDGDGWQTANPTAAADGGTGYTVETRLKVTVSSGSYGALVLNASTGDSSVNSWLVFTTNSVSWGHAAPTASNTITNFDATAWHTYRIVREPGTTVHSVWIDGTLAADNLASGISASINRLVLGSASGNYVGKAQVAYLRFHKGAYAPLDPDDKTRCKASTDFSVQYEMNSDDTRIPLSGNSSCWKAGGSGATIGKSAGVLSVTTAGKSAYWDTTDSAWKNHVSAATPFTAEFRIRISACTQSGADRAFNFITGTPGPLANLFIGTNSVQWCLSTSGAGTYVTLDNNDNTDEMHSFRISYSGGGRHAFTIWRDGEVIGENLVDCTNFYEYSGNALGIVRFGKAGGQNDGSWNLDYIRWDIGNAWEWKDPPSAFVITVR